jgi:hypothetical protein
MKKVFLTGMLLAISLLYCYENSMLNLFTPTGLKQGQAELMIRHRFYGDISEDPLDNFFGMDAGANVNLSGRYQFYDKAEVNFSYSRRKSEKTMGLSYLLELEDFPLFGQINLQYFSYQEEVLKEENRQNLLYSLALQHEELFDRFTATVNTAYDGYNERVILGAGLMVEVIDDLSFIAEYYPVLDRDSVSGNLTKYIGAEDAYAVGIKLDTYGHQFVFLLTNSDDIGLRRVSLGVPEDSHLRFGFNIQRRLDW